MLTTDEAREELGLHDLTAEQIGSILDQAQESGQVMFTSPATLTPVTVVVAHDDDQAWQILDPATSEATAAGPNRVGEPNQPRSFHDYCGKCPFCGQHRHAGNCDPLAHWTDGGDLVPGYGDSRDGQADTRDQRKADTR